jgi:ribonuclease HI
MKAKIFSDGGARGNPGPAAAAFVILGEDGKMLKEESMFLGIRTNNQAEYEALIAALTSAIELRITAAVCHLDSELVGKHLSGEYKVKNSVLLKLYQHTQALKNCFSEIQFVNVPRTNRFIEEADRLVNKKLDELSQ